MAICPKCSGVGVIGTECAMDGLFFVEPESLNKAPTGHLLGQLVAGKFASISIIGEGGIGIIYKTIQKPIGREVALKVMKDDFMQDEVLRERFLREAEVIATLTHPNIVTLYDCGLDKELNVMYMAMEYLIGDTMYMAMKEGLELDRIISIFKGIASGLGEAHRKGIVHRDLKPDNVFLIKDPVGQEVPKILDFGFARLQGAAKKLTMVGVAFGTPHYMSPEQAMGLDTIKSAADIYAVGVMLYEAISGKFPYDGNTPMEVMTKHVREAIPQCEVREGLHVPPSLLTLIERCLQKDAEDRYEDGTRLYEALLTVEMDILKAQHGVKDHPKSHSGLAWGRFFSNMERKYGRTNVILASFLILLGMLLIFVVILNLL